MNVLLTTLTFLALSNTPAINTEIVHEDYRQTYYTYVDGDTSVGARDKQGNLITLGHPNLKVENNNLYNLHFNVIGPSFQGMHKKMQEYYEKVAIFYDNIAERIKMLGGYPYTSLNKIEDVSTIKSMKSMDFNGNQVMEILDNDFSFLVDYTKDLVKIFNPLYTTDKSRKISGLGLSICKEIIESHNGTIKAINNKLGGFSIIFIIESYKED